MGRTACLITIGGCALLEICHILLWALPIYRLAPGTLGAALGTTIDVNFWWFKMDMGAAGRLIGLANNDVAKKLHDVCREPRALYNLAFGAQVLDLIPGANLKVLGMWTFFGNSLLAVYSLISVGFLIVVALMLYYYQRKGASKANDNFSGRILRTRVKVYLWTCAVFWMLYLVHVIVIILLTGNGLSFDLASIMQPTAIPAGGSIVALLALIINIVMLYHANAWAMKKNERMAERQHAMEKADLENLENDLDSDSEDEDDNGQEGYNAYHGRSPYQRAAQPGYYGGYQPVSPYPAYGGGYGSPAPMYGAVPASPGRGSPKQYKRHDF